MAKHISVTGVVQGVGFRPFVHGLAVRLDLHGWICNTPAGVDIYIEGEPPALDCFLHRLAEEKPPRARIDSIEVRTEASRNEYSTFEILPSIDLDDIFPPISADISLCPECERELFDPRNRRYLYPFISCALCGPRFTIIKGLPYDRSNTTMAEFGMCEGCTTEYTEALGRRYQAHSIACPECGPFVALRELHSQFPYSGLKISSIECRTSAILKARRLLREGYILGIKGLGGFHLACDASNTLTVEELRARKGGIGRPFALMASSLEVARSICDVSRAEEELLAGREKPIVVLRKKLHNGSTYSVSKWVAPSLDTLGVMLPYSALHHLLLNQTDPLLATEPAPPLLVMTSGNLSDEPIATDNEDALLRLSTLVDAFILHNRVIHVRCEDSVVRLDAGPAAPDREKAGSGSRASSAHYLRRSRGYAPYPVELPFKVHPTLAVGGEWNNTFCLARDRYGFLSHHIGNMENVGTYESFEQGVRHLSHVFQIKPEVIAHDLHPDYFSTQYVRRSSLNARRIPVQHHHAHIASCMADNHLQDRHLIGLAFDGTGYGTDGSIWGGEVLLASYSDFERFAHLEQLPLPGGDSAIRSPWRTAYGYACAFDLDVEGLSFLRNIDSREVETVRQQVDQGHNAPLSSSMGRLFDAVSSLIGVRNETTYEGQAAIELEVLARPFIPSAAHYPFTLEASGSGPVIRVRETLAAIIRDLREGLAAGLIAARFHLTVAEMALEACRQASQSTGLQEVALSGGVWQNQVLLDLVRTGLSREGFTVYFHNQVPTNDGGLALGQTLVANCRLGMQEAVPAATGGLPAGSGE